MANIIMDSKQIVLLTDRISIHYKGLTYSYNMAFKKLGYQVKVVPFAINEKVYRISKFMPIINNTYLSLVQRKVIKEIVKSKIKLVFVIKGMYLLPSTLQFLRDKGVRVFCFNPDDPFSIIAGSSNLNIKDCIPLYDAYFIWSRKLQKKLKEEAVANTYYLPFAADVNITKPPDDRDGLDKQIDVSFIGNGDKERKSFLQELGSAIESDGFASAIFGTGWGHLAGFDLNGQVYNQEFLNSIYKSKINLNILREQNKGSHNMRTFDIPACGGFMLHEYSEEVADFFEEGKEFVSFKTVEECADKIRFFIHNTSEREKIALAGYNRLIKSSYNYLHNIERMEKILSVINE